MFHKVIVEKRGLNTLLEIYATIRSDGRSFLDAIEKHTGWNVTDLDREVKKMLKIAS
jgi:hypothetical protein